MNARAVHATALSEKQKTEPDRTGYHHITFAIVKFSVTTTKDGTCRLGLYFLANNKARLYKSEIYCRCLKLVLPRQSDANLL